MEKEKRGRRKIKVIFIIALLISLIMTLNVLAVTPKTELKIIQEASETKYLENDQGYISKTIVDSNSETGEVTIELKVANESKEEENEETYENTEIYILVSENLVNNEEKLLEYKEYIETLATNVFEKNSNTKIGIIGIKGTINDSTENEDGSVTWGENDEGDVNGTADNAEIVAELTNDKEKLINEFNKMNSSKERYRINLQAAVRLANSKYSDKTNKILISLYDGVPSIAIGVCSSVSSGGWFSEYSTEEEAVVAKHEKIVKYTKNEILKLKDNNVSFIQLRPDDTSYDEEWYSNDTGEKTLDFDGSPYVQELYGTLENPVYGKMYSLSNDSLEKIVIQYIYNDITEIIQADINTVKIVDYFPEDITENFEFSYVGTPSLGTVSEDINSETNTIEWDIGTLKGDEVATLKYKLKIKDMSNEELLNKTIATNEKVVLTYKDSDAKDYTVTLSSSPKIQLSEVKEELTATVSYDPTTETTGTVTATIKTNKKVNAVDGWTLSDDGMTLTKTYSTNSTETVHLVDVDNMTKDVEINISNITSSTNTNNDTTTAPITKLPQTGISCGIVVALAIGVVVGIILFFKYRKMKDIV